MAAESGKKERKAQGPACGYRPALDPTLVCHRRHEPGEGHHMDGIRRLYFDEYEGKLRTYLVGWMPGQSTEPVRLTKQTRRTKVTS